MEDTGELAEAYQELLDSYEELTGAALSQEKQHSEWHCDPIPNLSQAYPYPSKEEEDTNDNGGVCSPVKKRRRGKNKGKAKLDATDSEQPTSGERKKSKVVVKAENSKRKALMSSSGMSFNLTPEIQPRLTNKSLFAEKNSNSPHMQYEPSLSVDIDASQVEPSTQNLMLLQQLVSDVDVVLAELNNEASPKSILQNDTQDTMAGSPSDTRCSSPDLFDSSEVTSQNQDPPEMPVILGTMLKASQTKKLNSTAKKLHASVVAEFKKDVTHLVTEAVKGTSRRTMKYFLAILHGRWLVSYQWVEDSLKRNEWLEEDAYEIIGDEHFSNYGPRRARQSIKKQEPRLFQGQQYFLAGEFKQPARDDLIMLLNAGGATVLDRWPPANNQQVRVICDNKTSMRTKNKYREQYSCEVVFANWVLDSISNYKLIDTLAYH
ncbi:hypothetical protein K493DRAFT_409078 [Basidiobolus meristosporus CBS 931.73]|uniref:BRCT domain-containing protein n=1 Tax=Basidiobolus meristosporus CBS 931.73 TaxID=1314790 RepID=A0A1Y1Y1K1_9FUNG|nr:hypothetical protein K493DRAFT_409078 [Basidiobolus meristosporus CBS 931.73]|eukprot:ORX91892.1 hypothetical protein K493DRAFT_409078 [Basidiobolus meristosporus CBS 931.73]